MKKTVLAFLFLAVTLMAGCNTMHGAGEDIQQGGEKIQGAADRNK